MKHTNFFRAALAAIFLVVIPASGGPAERSPEKTPSEKPSEAVKKLEAARTKFGVQLEKIQEEYRQTLAASVAEADYIELYEVDYDKSRKAEGTSFNFGADDSKFDAGWLPIREEKSEVKIVKTRKLSAEERMKVAKTIKEMLVHPGEVRAMCFIPHHGIRMWSGGRMVFESAICLECAAFTVPSPHPYVSDWSECLPDFVAPVISALMPLPPSKSSGDDNPKPKGPKK